MEKKSFIMFILILVAFSVLIGWLIAGKPSRTDEATGALAVEQPQSNRSALKRPDPDRRIMSGKPVPDFEITLLDGKEKVSNKSLKGKFYLLDFWATWCGPCVAEMENLHNAYQKFKDKNFVILSLSVDEKIEDLNKFRANKWKMPWLHAYMLNETNHKMLEAFEVKSIPMPIFVGFDGRIIATGNNLRGNQLEKTLADFLR